VIEEKIYFRALIPSIAGLSSFPPFPVAIFGSNSPFLGQPAPEILRMYCWLVLLRHFLCFVFGVDFNSSAISCFI